MSEFTDSNDSRRRGPIAWMATNSIAANLMMLVLVFGGLLFASQVTQEVFPEFDLDVVNVRVPYPGASPAEVEQGILLVVEDQTSGVEGVKKVTSQALEGVGTVALEVALGADRDRVLQDVKNEVDRIVTFPEEAEQPIVSLSSRNRPVLSVIVHGEAPEESLRALAERVRDELVAEDDITLVELESVRGYEISVEIPSDQLRAHGLTLPGVAETIRRSALELPAGEVRTDAGEVLLRTQDRRNLASEFAELPLVSSADGTLLRIGDVGLTRDGFSEDDFFASFDGAPAIELVVSRVGKEGPIAVARAARNALDRLGPDLPEGIGLSVWNDQSKSYSDRIDLLSRNAFLGLGLVLLLLGLFLEPRIAFWVTMGILISVVGSFLVFPSTGATINMVSLFAFIVTLGIVVDDAIIVAENIFEQREQGKPPLQAAIDGAREIAGPVTFAVLTNIIAFMPLFFVPGAMGKIFRQIPAVVVSVFVISLVESLLILPAHLAHARPPGPLLRALGAPNRAVTRWFRWFDNTLFAPVLTAALRFRYYIPAIGLFLLAMTAGIVGGGKIRTSFLPRVDSDIVTATARLPVGVPVASTRLVEQALLEGLRDAQDDLGAPVVDAVFARIGGQSGAANELTVRAALVPPGQRELGGMEFGDAWRRAVGEVTGIDALTFSARNLGSGSKAIDIELTGPDPGLLDSAARDLAGRLSRYSAVNDLDDGTATGKRQISLSLNPEGNSLGLDANDVANQLRGAFFGAEALRQQRGRNEVKVMVRLPLEERERLSTFEQMVVRVPQGGEVPLSVVANLEDGRSYTSIDRRDGQRVVSVTGEVDLAISDAGTVLEAVQQDDLPELLADYDGLAYSLSGEQEDRAESLSALGLGLVFAVLAIFAMLAIPLGSYSMPLIVLSGAPFGIIGALLGHFVLGYGLSLMSFFGIVALTGVVVNDSLVLVVTANRYREQGKSAFDSIREASIRRLRPILLTSLTTSLGLLPMMLESSTQARFLVPMAISLGFGVLFSTLVILLMVPALYLIREDVIELFAWARTQLSAPQSIPSDR